jgi:hypothetical protein
MPLARSGSLAVLALPPVAGAPVAARSAFAAPAATLPRRQPRTAPVGRPTRAAPTPAVLRQAWASDVATMQRLLGALQRLA